MPKETDDRHVVRISPETYKVLQMFADVLRLPIEEVATQMIEKQMQEAARHNPELAKLILLRRTW